MSWTDSRPGRGPRWALALVLVVVAGIRARGDEPPIESFPVFHVPGHDAEMATLRSLFQLHFGPRTNCALWDPWLPMASLWPAVGPTETADEMRAYYRDSLLQRPIDAEGYVATQQHRGLGHSEGWPFPTWPQANGSGWHFSLADDGYARGLGVRTTRNLKGWVLQDLEVEALDPDQGLQLNVTGPAPMLTTPGFHVEAISAPFARVEWSASGFDPEAIQTLRWTTEAQAAWGDDQRMTFPVPDAPGSMRYAMVPLYRHPAYGSPLTRMRIEFNAPPGATLVVKSLITAVDTRHPINNAIYLQGCADYLAWTGDIAFLEANLDRMITALRFALDEFKVIENGYVVVPWVGHDGVSGLRIEPDGTKRVEAGRGVGNNYWDLLPFGGKDALATLYLYQALGSMRDLAVAIGRHPEWNIPAAKGQALAELVRPALERISTTAPEFFWNGETGRFVGWIDAQGEGHDVGHTSLSLEAITYGFATPAQAGSILDWLDGRRIVAGDTSTGADIYHWRFAPRATTRRNVETYAWVWSNPESIPWGDQVQDGGAVLGWSYFDLMARLRVRGPDDAWRRLQAILAWFDEVQAGGGYRAYYAVAGRGHLQGAGTPGGLGLDAEFMESVLVPQVMIRGFLGLEPGPDATRLVPRLPSDWPSLAVRGVHLKQHVLDITATPDRIELIRRGGDPAQPLVLQPGTGQWEVGANDETGGWLGSPVRYTLLGEDDPIPILFGAGDRVSLSRVSER